MDTNRQARYSGSIGLLSRRFANGGYLPVPTPNQTFRYRPNEGIHAHGTSFRVPPAQAKLIEAPRRSARPPILRQAQDERGGRSGAHFRPRNACETVRRRTRRSFRGSGGSSPGASLFPLLNRCAPTHSGPSFRWDDDGDAQSSGATSTEKNIVCSEEPRKVPSSGATSE